MADKKPAGPPEAITNAAAGCADPASDENRAVEWAFTASLKTRRAYR